MGLQVKISKKKVLFMLIFVLIATMNSGCTKQDWMDLAEVGKAWARANDILDENNQPSWTTLGRVMTNASTGDQGIDAVIDSAVVVKSFAEAEKLSEDARKERSIKKMNTAVGLRPKDYVYRNQRGAMLFFTGDEKAAEEDFATADQVITKKNSELNYRNLNNRANVLRHEMDLYENDYRQVRKYTATEFHTMLTKYNQKMADIYKELFTLTKDPQYEAVYKKYENAAQ